MLMRKGDDSGMRTVESLRGRLLAEREASKTAKNEADLIAKRLGELERQLAKEIKSRNRAQKRLEYALKKLKLLNLPESSQSSSEGWKAHPGTATGSSEQSGSQGEVEETMSSVGLKDVAEDDGSGSSTGDSANRIVPQEESWSSVGTAHSWNKDQEPVLDEDISCRDYQGLIDTDVRRSPLGANEPDEHSADALALVPAEGTPPSSSACHDPEKKGSNVQEVLLALRHVKEHLRNSMGTTRAAAAAALPSRKELYDT